MGSVGFKGLRLWVGVFSGLVCSVRLGSVGSYALEVFWCWSGLGLVALARFNVALVVQSVG